MPEHSLVIFSSVDFGSDIYNTDKTMQSFLNDYYPGNPYNRPPRERTTFTESHLKVLEDCFNEVKHPNSIRREKLATELGLPVKTIQIWFQNRRARERKWAKKSSDGKNRELKSISGVLGNECCLNDSLGKYSCFTNPKTTL